MLQKVRAKRKEEGVKNSKIKNQKKKKKKIGKIFSREHYDPQADYSVDDEQRYWRTPHHMKELNLHYQGLLFVFCFVMVVC